MRKVLTVALVALLLFAATGVLAVADEAPDEVAPGDNGSSDSFHPDDDDDEPGEAPGVTPHNPISVGP
jgi:hypothetical protein